MILLCYQGTHVLCHYLIVRDNKLRELRIRESCRYKQLKQTTFIASKFHSKTSNLLYHALDRLIIINRMIEIIFLGD